MASAARWASEVRLPAVPEVVIRLRSTGQWLSVEDLNVPGQRFTGTVVDNRVEGVFEIEHPHYDGAGAPPYPAPPVEDEALRAYLEPSAFIESAGLTTCTSSTFSNWCWRIMPRVSLP